MRNPVAPIPSPNDSSDRARRYWGQRAPLPPTPGSSHAHQAGHEYDPTRALRGRGDVLGLDRRGNPRGSDEPQPGRRRSQHVAADPVPGSPGLAGAAHASITGIFGLQTRFGWALVRGLSLGPEGVLVELVDLLDPELDPVLAREAKRWLPSLSTALARGPQATTPQRNGGVSMLGTVGSCVLARRLVADLARWAGGRGNAERALGVTLLVPDQVGSSGNRRPTFVQIPGALAPLTDPAPSVLGVQLTAAAGHRLRIATRTRDAGRAGARPRA